MPTEQQITEADANFILFSAKAEIAREKLAWMKANKTKTYKDGEVWEDVLFDYNNFRAFVLHAQNILITAGYEAVIERRLTSK